MENNSIELLAPAGDIRVMKACYNAGADAVYMGLPRFSARAYADNADTGDYLEAIDYAHLHGKRLYLTVNTLFKEKELLSELYDVLKPLYERGLDAVIVQDLGAIACIREWFPGLNINASTQCTVTSASDVRELQKYGISRYILARELSLKEIRKIKDETGAELECFIHGALCYCYSGQCLFSSIAGGRSGNRGRCAQPCRMAYSLSDEDGKTIRKDAYLLSLKDLNGLEFLPEILESGVTSLKIEGRMKKAEYAAGVTSVYRKYLDRLLEKGKEDYEVAREDQKILYDLFNRQGFTEGYFKKQNGQDMLTLKESAFREENKSLTDRIRSEYIDHEKKTGITGFYSFRGGELLKLTVKTELYGKNYEFTAVSESTAEKAEKKGADRESIEKQLKKTGSTSFVFEKLDGESDPDLFLPVKVLNDLRRAAIEGLEKEILASFKRNDAEKKMPEDHTGALKDGDTGSAEMHLSACVRDRYQLKAALFEESIAEIILSSAVMNPETWKKTAEDTHAAGKKLYLQFPLIWRYQAEAFFDKNLDALRGAGFDGWLIPNHGAHEFIGKNHLPGICIADHNLYAFNSRSVREVKNFGFDRITVPVELNRYEITETGFQGQGMILYGRNTMMTTANCLHKTCGKCDKKPTLLYLKDRKNNMMPVFNDCRFCQNTILNGLPLSLLEDKEAVGKIGLSEGRLVFTTEDYEQTRDVIRKFSAVYSRHEDDVKLSFRTTHGHFRRGVE